MLIVAHHDPDGWSGFWDEGAANLGFGQNENESKGNEWSGARKRDGAWSQLERVDGGRQIGVESVTVSWHGVTGGCKASCFEGRSRNRGLGGTAVERGRGLLADCWETTANYLLRE